MFTLWLPYIEAGANVYSYNMITGVWDHISYNEAGIICFYPSKAHEYALTPVCYYPNMPYVKREGFTMGETFETVNVGEMFFVGNERFIKINEYEAWGQLTGLTDFSND